MRTLLLILNLVVLTACGTWLDPWREPHKRKGSVDPLEARLAYYCANYADPVSPLDGDSLYFTGFTRTACGDRSLKDYEVSSGRFQRWPVTLGFKWDDPAPSGEGTRARSENSRDGYLATLWNAWARKDLRTLEDIRDHGRKRDWFMGDGRFGGLETLFTPALRSTLAQMIYVLGGENDWLDRQLPVSWGSCEDFECWLQVSHILLRGEAFGQISAQAYGALEEASAKFPQNPLYKWAKAKYNNGVAGPSIQAALDWCPADRLSTLEDYCDEWPLRRGPGSNGLEPCPEGESLTKPFIHSNGDCSFSIWIIKRG